MVYIFEKIITKILFINIYVYIINMCDNYRYCCNFECNCNNIFSVVYKPNT